MLAQAMGQERPGDRRLVGGFGQGVDVLVLEVGQAARPAEQRGVAGALAEGLATDSYLRMLSLYDGIDMEWGMRSERSNKTALTEQHRSSQQNAGSVAACCTACGPVQFPRLKSCVTPSCSAPATHFGDLPRVTVTAT